MITINNTIYLCRDDDYKQNLKVGNKNTKVILLKEDIFIKTIKLTGKENIENILEENVSSTFSDYDKLIHYDLLKINKEKFIIIYFINYYNILRNIVSKCKTIEITPYQLISNKGRLFKGISVIVTSFKENLYLIIKINGVVVHTKNIIESEIEEAIALSIEALESDFQLSGLKTKFYLDKNMEIYNIKEII